MRMPQTLSVNSTHRIAVVGPGCPLHRAVLDVKWKVLDRNVARGFEHAMAQPNNLSGVGNDHISVNHCGVISSIRTDTRDVKRRQQCSYFLLVVKNDIRSPNLFIRQPNGFDVSEIGVIPCEMSVIPYLKL